MIFVSEFKTWLTHYLPLLPLFLFLHLRLLHPLLVLSFPRLASLTSLFTQLCSFLFGRAAAYLGVLHVLAHKLGKLLRGGRHGGGRARGDLLLSLCKLSVPVKTKQRTKETKIGNGTRGQAARVAVSGKATGDTTEHAGRRRHRTHTPRRDCAPPRRCRRSN